MLITVYITIDPKQSHPYATTYPPSPERLQALKRQGCRCFEAVVDVPIEAGERLPTVPAFVGVFIPGESGEGTDGG